MLATSARALAGDTRSFALQFSQAERSNSVLHWDIRGAAVWTKITLPCFRSSLCRHVFLSAVSTDGPAVDLGRAENQLYSQGAKKAVGVEFDVGPFLAFPPFDFRAYITEIEPLVQAHHQNNLVESHARPVYWGWNSVSRSCIDLFPVRPIGGLTLVQMICDFQ